MNRGDHRDVLTVWFGDSISILEELFGAEDNICNRLRFIELKYKEERSKSSTSPSVALQDSIDILRKAIERIDEYGIARNNLAAHPLWYVLGIPVFLFLASLYSTPMQRLLGLNEDDLLSQAMIHNDSLIQVQQEKERLSKIEILKSDLQSWHEENNAKYTNALDSLNVDQASRGVYSSGIAVKQVIEFSKSFRMKRDNTIDSFFVRLEALGLNVNTLDIKKKLPINLSQYLKPRIEGYRLIRYYANMRLDTL